MRILFLFWIFGSMVYGLEYILVVNKNTDIDSLNILQVRSIFLKKQTMMNELELVPINLPAFHEARRSFETNVLDMSQSRLKSYWVKQHYQGHRPPLTMKSFQGLKAFIKNVDGAIGYIPADAMDSSLKQVYRWSQ